MESTHSIFLAPLQFLKCGDNQEEHDLNELVSYALFWASSCEHYFNSYVHLSITIYKWDISF